MCTETWVACTEAYCNLLFLKKIRKLCFFSDFCVGVGVGRGKFFFRNRISLRKYKHLIFGQSLKPAVLISESSALTV